MLGGTQSITVGPAAVSPRQGAPRGVGAGEGLLFAFIFLLKHICFETVTHV